jgi:hypothetical protein
MITVVLIYIAYMLYQLNDNIVTFGENFNDYIIDQLEAAELEDGDRV